MKAHNVSLGLKIKVNNMALIQQKQVSGLVAGLAAKDSVSAVNSKDTSILALATAADTAQSVDSKDTSILALASSSATNLSVDSKDTSILSLATAADTAQSVDSKDASILAAAEVLMAGYFKDNVTPGYKLDLSQTGPLLDPANNAVGTYNATVPANGQARITLNSGIEGANATEWEMNIIGIFINGLRLDQTEVSVSAQNTVDIDAAFPFDEGDSLEIRYNKEG